MIALDNIAREIHNGDNINRVDGIQRNYYNRARRIDVEEISNTSLTDYQFLISGLVDERDRIHNREGIPQPFFVESVSRTWTRGNVSALGRTNFVQYMDNPAATIASDGAATFDFFDDFLGTAIDTTRWFVSANSFSVADSILRINVGGVGLQVALPFNLQAGYIAETRCLFNTLESAYSGTLPQFSSSRWTQGMNAGADATILYMRESNSRQLVAFIGNGAAASYNVLFNHLLWHSVENVWYITGISVRGGIVELWQDGTVAHTTTGIAWVKEQRFFALGFFTGGAAENIQDTSYDWIRIRRHASPEPMVIVRQEVALT